LVRVATGLLVAVLALCGCGEPSPEPLPPGRTGPTHPPTTQPPGEEVVGWCLASPVGQQKGIVRGQFIRCGLRPRPGFLFRGRVVGVSFGVNDLPPYDLGCPQMADDVVFAQLPSGKQALLCLDTKPGDGNTRG
jgi:hypothetical protein